MTQLNRILITGGVSCSGRHAISAARKLGFGDVVATVRCEQKSIAEHEIFRCDFASRDEIRSVIKRVRPSTVLHLAASSDPSSKTTIMQTNVMGVANLLEACEELCQKVDVLLVGSAASFGDMCFSEESLSGDRECKPTSLYGRTRQMQLELGQLADESKQVNVFLCRTFNLIGPGLSERYVPAALLKRIAEAHQRGKKQIAVRDLNVVRDFIDTRDAVSAYFAILKNGRTKYPYSVGTGKGVTIRHLAETIVREFGIRLVITDDQLSSSNPRSEISRSIADPTRLTDDTGWKPEFSLEQSIRDMIRCNHTLPNV